MENRNISKPVLQKHPFGCGVACVAFILGRNYSATLKLFRDGKCKVKNRGFYCKEIVEVLNKKEAEFEYKYIKDGVRRKIYQDYSIVFVKRSKKYPVGHYLCRYKNIWIDPWINFQKNQNIKEAEAGSRKRLPGKAVYVILPKTK